MKDPSLRGKKITVHTVPEGDVYLYDGKRRLDYERVEASPAALAPPPTVPLVKAPDSRAKARQRAWLFAST